MRMRTEFAHAERKYWRSAAGMAAIERRLTCSNRQLAQLPVGARQPPLDGGHPRGGAPVFSLRMREFSAHPHSKGLSLMTATITRPPDQVKQAQAPALAVPALVD